MGYYVPNRVMPICYNCPYRTNKYCGLLTEHDYLGDYPLNYEPYPYCPLTDRPQGEWIRTGRTNIYGGIEVQCSNCGDKVMVQHLEDEWYCRHCGADMGMKGADDE